MLQCPLFPLLELQLHLCCKHGKTAVYILDIKMTSSYEKLKVKNAELQANYEKLLASNRNSSSSRVESNDRSTQTEFDEENDLAEVCLFWQERAKELESQLETRSEIRSETRVEEKVNKKGWTRKLVPLLLPVALQGARMAIPLLAGLTASDQARGTTLSSATPTSLPLL